MATLQQAIDLTKKGFWVFPLVAGEKTPIYPGKYRSYATRDEKILRQWWIDPLLGLERDYNIGICTDLFGDKGEALVVIDIDKKEGKNGFETLKKLKTMGKTFPKTAMAKTPTGGVHLFYRTEKAIKQGSNVLGPGVDIRSSGGLVVGAGSSRYGFVDLYTMDDANTRNCPEWVKEGRDVTPKSSTKLLSPKHTVTSSNSRAISYLKTVTPAIQGQGGDEHTYKVACKLRDMGVEQHQAIHLMLHNFNERCEPPWDGSELVLKINNAYAYATGEFGKDSPENDFDVLNVEYEDPVLKYNKDHCLILDGGKVAVMWKTFDENDEPKTEQLPLESFYTINANDLTKVEKETKTGTKIEMKQAARLWVMHRKRNTKRGIIFRPGLNHSEHYYNWWEGFSVNPLPPDEKPTLQMTEAVGAFNEHIYENVCNKNESERIWLMTFFAHMFQKPEEKPLVAPVLVGPRGVGKDTVVECVGNLIKKYYLMPTSAHYLVGNFNEHFEKCLFVVFNEAFWSGDRKAEGILKNLITGRRHLVEKKFFSARMMDNYMRVVIMGNDDWIVPAAYDERRFAVFNVGSKRKQDVKFFSAIHKGMNAGGGNRYLLRNFLDWDLEKAHIDIAPKTRGLYEQKLETQTPVEQWWVGCLSQGSFALIGSEQWQNSVDCGELRDIFYKHCRDRGVRSRLPSDKSFGRSLKKFTPSISRRKKSDGSCWEYDMPSLDKCRDGFSSYVGYDINWNEF